MVTCKCTVTWKFSILLSQFLQSFVECIVVVYAHIGILSLCSSVKDKEKNGKHNESNLFPMCWNNSLPERFIDAYTFVVLLTTPDWQLMKHCNIHSLRSRFLFHVICPSQRIDESYTNCSLHVCDVILKELNSKCNLN